MSSTIKICGDWYDGKQSVKQAAVFSVSIDAASAVNLAPVNVVVRSDQEPLFKGSWADVGISQRLGNTPRYFNFPDGQKFESRENDNIDQLINQLNPKQTQSLIYRLETHWRYVLTSILITVLLIAWTGIYGVPMASKAIAYALPNTLLDKAGEQTLELLDEQFLQSTKLAPKVRERVRDHFATIIEEHSEQNIRLYFRASPEVGANAFALPNGSIIFTDDMIKLAQHDDELLSVMAHEVGHVVKRHGMRSVIQGSLVAFSLILMTGDVSATSELFLGIPVILTQLGYSRDFERESDDYALAYLLERDINPENFSNLMSRLQESKVDSSKHSEKEVATIESEKPDEQNADIDPTKEPNKQWQRYLSTHPGIEERIEKFKRQN